jgi:hypothetical protein
MPADSTPPRPITLSVEHHTPDSVITRLSNNFTTQLAPGGVYLSFYEAVLPLIMGDPEDVKLKFSKITSIRAECVARIFVPNEHFAEFTNTIQTMHTLLTSNTSTGATDSKGSQS